MQALDDVDWGHADGGDEEFGTRVDDYGDEFVEFTFCIVVAREYFPGQKSSCERAV